jgi:hypothetical protein
MNQRGEITVLGSLLILCLTAIVILAALELERSFKKLEARTKILLCAKETKGELNELLTLMGRTNWGIKNLHRIKIISILFPGAFSATQSAEKVKKGLQKIQNLRMMLHLKKISGLKLKGCPLDTGLVQTPFETDGLILRRNQEGGVRLRSAKWEHHLFLRFYKIQLMVVATEWEVLSPRLDFKFKDSPVRSSFLLRAF